MNAVERMASQAPGTCLRLVPDYFVLNDLYGHRVLEQLQKEPAGLERIHIFIDHVVPSDCPETDAGQVRLRNFARNHPVHFREGGGIAYPLLAEESLVPGQVVVGAGSHISCCGALGCLPVQVDETQLAEAINKGSLEWKIPESITLVLTGKFTEEGDVRSLAMEIGKMDLPRDCMLVLRAGEGVCPGVGDRMTLCGALGELGYPAVIFLPDQEVYRYLEQQGRKAEPVRLPWERSIRKIRLSLSKVVPQVREPEHNQILPLAQIGSRPVKAVFIGGCMGGNEEDIRKAASFMKGKYVAENRRVLAVPNTQRVYLKAVKEGWIDVLEDAGVMVMNPHCSACWGKAQGHLMEDEAAVTTGFRNAPGCLGAQGARVYITSLETALKCAVTGRLEACDGENV